MTGDPRIRPLRIGEILEKALRLVWQNLGLMLALDLSFVPVLLAAGFLTPDTPEEILGSAIGLLLVALVIQTFGAAATTFAVRSLYFGEPIRLGTAFRMARPRVFALLLTQVLGGGLALVGFLLLIVPGVYLGLAFLVLGPVVVLEGISQAKALTRSHSLMGANFLRGAGLVLVSLVVFSLAGSAAAFLGTAAPELAGGVEIAMNAVAAGYFNAAVVIFYFDLRCRKEGFRGQEIEGDPDSADTHPIH